MSCELDPLAYKLYSGCRRVPPGVHWRACWQACFRRLGGLCLQHTCARMSEHVYQLKLLLPPTGRAYAFYVPLAPAGRSPDDFARGAVAEQQALSWVASFHTDYERVAWRKSLARFGRQALSRRATDMARSLGISSVGVCASPGAGEMAGCYAQIEEDKWASRSVGEANAKTNKQGISREIDRQGVG